MTAISHLRREIGFDPWAALRHAILAAYPAATDDRPDVLRLVLVTSDGRRVGVRIRATTAYGEPVAIVAADLGAATGLDPFEALLVNAILVHGALSICDGVLELRAVLHLAQFGWPRFDVAMRELAAEAAELKARLSVSTTSAAENTSAFAHLVD
jgi:hypothetical protein